MSIRIARTDAEIAGCWRVMHQLRPSIEEASFVARVRDQEAGGFLLAYLEDAGAVQAVAGYRFLENLCTGRVLYVDDLVTDAAGRSKGYGQLLFDWLVAEAHAAGCQSLELDSGVQRFDAHRFYLRNRMAISSHHFRLVLKP